MARVLFVDDNPESLSYVRVLLQRHGLGTGWGHTYCP